MIGQAVLDALPFGVPLTDADMKVEHMNFWLAQRQSAPPAALRARPLAGACPELVERRLLAADDLARREGNTVRLPASQYTHFLKLLNPIGDKQADMPRPATIEPLVEDGRVVGTLAIIEGETQRLLRERQLQHQVDKMTAVLEVNCGLARTEATCITKRRRKAALWIRMCSGLAKDTK